MRNKRFEQISNIYIESASFLQYSEVMSLVHTLISSLFRASRFQFNILLIAFVLYVELFLDNVLHPVLHVLDRVEVRRVARPGEERDVLLGKQGLADLGGVAEGAVLLVVIQFALILVF